MIYGDTDMRAMIRVLSAAISRVASGERSLELFGVNADGKAEDVVLIIIDGDDWSEVHRRLGDMYDIDHGGYEEHDFGNAEDN